MSFLRKIGLSLLTLWGVSVVVFLLLFLVPRLGAEKGQDPTDAMAQTVAGAHATKENIARIKTDLGLDKPLIVQYGLFVRNALTNNLKSYRNGDVVFTAILRRFPATLLLAATALAIYLGAAIPIALVTARNDGKWLDRLALLLPSSRFRFRRSGWDACCSSISAINWACSASVAAPVCGICPYPQSHWASAARRITRVYCTPICAA